ncbi:MAG: GGDEF domain-containing protein, partial [candidate division Zixibacteria bacterium]|nr:GGDEF domain-containing protein [candidate division Zixibacteria bacterium]
MAKLVTFGKEYLLSVAEIFFFLALFGILLLIDFPIYLKLASAFIFILFVVGWFLLSFSKQQQRYQLLAEEQKQNSEKLKRLLKLTVELPGISFVRNKLPEITPTLIHLFREYFNSDKFLLFVKKGNAYQVLVANKVTLPERSKITIKSNTEFISLLKSAEELKDLEFIQSVKVPSSFRSLQKQYRFDRLIPLATESDLWGFVMLSCDKPSAENLHNVEHPLDEKFPLSVLNQIALSLEKEDLSSKLEELESKSNTNSKLIRTELSVLNSDLKRKIFDLNAVLGLVKNLYSMLEEEGLFSVLARMMQDQLGAKSVFLMLPHKENGDVVGETFYGAQTSDLFGKRSISELRIEKGKALYNWIKNEKQIWRLYTMQRISREEELLKALLDFGFQIGAKLSFDRDSFGIVFLGEKTDGAKYRQIDLDILAILVDMGVITYRNIKRFKSIEELSYTDSITGLYNYRYFYKRLTEEVFRAKRFGRKLAFVIFDIDDFKIYNDTYGHQAGDQLLKQLGELLSNTVRSIDVVSRYGGEEFCVIMPESDQQECLKFTERLRKNIMNFPFKSEFGSHLSQLT